MGRVKGRLNAVVCGDEIAVGMHWRELNDKCCPAADRRLGHQIGVCWIGCPEKRAQSICFSDRCDGQKGGMVEREGRGEKGGWMMMIMMMRGRERRGGGCGGEMRLTESESAGRE